MPQRILILKLAALGDVLRTTPVLPALRKIYPDAHITWVTDPDCLGLLETNRDVNRLLPLEYPALLPLQVEEFDLILSLDKDPAAAALTSQVKGKVKRGFGWNAAGSLCPLDEKADYAYRLGVDNELKFKFNQKTYQQITFEMCDLPYAGEEYQWEPTAEDLQQAKFWAKGTGLDRRRPTIGLNTGWGEKFAGKGWKEEHWNTLVERLQNQDANILLLGGFREAELNGNLFRRHRGRGSLHHAGTSNSLGQFAGIVDLCDLVVSGDTFGMHAAIARKKKVVALFGSTCPQEIELYGRGIKLYPTDLPCSPCYKKVCDYTPVEDCLRRISVDQVFEGIGQLLPLAPVKKEAQEISSARVAEDVARETNEPVLDEEARPEKQFSGSGQKHSSRHERQRDRRWRRFRPRNLSATGDTSRNNP